MGCPGATSRLHLSAPKVATDSSLARAAKALGPFICTENVMHSLFP